MRRRRRIVPLITLAAVAAVAGGCADDEDGAGAAVFEEPEGLLDETVRVDGEVGNVVARSTSRWRTMTGTAPSSWSPLTTDDERTE